MYELIAVVQDRISETGMMQKAVAEKAGMDEQALSSFLNGRRNLYATEFIGLCKVLDFGPEDVLNYGKPKNEQADGGT